MTAKHSDRLIGLLLLAALVAPIPTARAEAPPSSSEIVGALQPFVKRGTLAGAVTLVASKDRALSLDAVGHANIKASQPMRGDTVFWIASQTKPITAVALMMLVDEGKVKLDDPVTNYLPELKDLWLIAEQGKDRLLLKRPGRAITLRHLLSHTSGMPFRSEMEQPTLDQLRLRDAVRSYALTPLGFEPTTRFLYSNAGINTAGRVIEVVSGLRYEEFMNRRLFEPLGMTDTTFWPRDDQLKRLATPYKPNAERTGLEATTISQLTYPLDDRNRQPMPAGGLFSTAADVGTFCRMVLNGGTLNGKRYLSEAAVKEMTSKQTDDRLKASYGLGWSTGGGSYGHGGALATNMTIDPARGLITVFLVQHAGFPGDGGSSQQAFRKAVETRFGQKKESGRQKGR